MLSLSTVHSYYVNRRADSCTLQSKYFLKAYIAYVLILSGMSRRFGTFILDGAARCKRMRRLIFYWPFCVFQAPHFTLVKEALIEIGCVVTSSVVGRWLVGRWLSRACTVAKRCILGL